MPDAETTEAAVADFCKPACQPLRLKRDQKGVWLLEFHTPEDAVKVSWSDVKFITPLPTPTFFLSTSPKQARQALTELPHAGGPVRAFENQIPDALATVQATVCIYRPAARLFSVTSR